MLPDMFLVKEKSLRKEIQQGELPFLGLFADHFPAETRKFIKQDIQRSDSPIKRVSDGLRKFPALLSTYLVAHVMEGFGATGYFSVWPYLSDALGIEIPENKKIYLWQEFRKACLGLGLSVSPRLYGAHFMVEEYLRQAGYPLNFIDQLTGKMVKYAEDVGMPDEDDPNFIEVWRNGLLERLNPPFSKVARAAIEMDHGGYYVRLFVRLFRRIDERESWPADSEIERRMLNALTNVGRRARVKKVAIPQIIFRNYQVGILLPAAIDRQWEVESSGVMKRYPSLDEERFVALEERLPFQVKITDYESGVSWNYPIWEDETNNRFLIFSMPTGQLKTRAKISDKEIHLDPGDYALVSRFKPDNEGEIEVLSGQPVLYFQRFSLNPGKTVELRRGPACILLRAYDVATIRWQGDPLHGVRGEVIYPSKNLKLEITIPEEILLASDSQFVLSLHSNSLGDRLEIPLTSISENSIAIGIEPYLSKWKPGVTRLLAELRKKDSRRALVRSSILFWHGLSKVIRRISFFCDNLPENILKEECENILFKGNIITYRDDMNRFFRMVFSDGERRVSTTWAVPGIFLYLEKYSEGGVEEYPLRIGSTVSVSPISRDILKIFATDDAILNIGSLQIQANFEKLGSKSIPLASLRDYIGPQNNQLLFIKGATGERIPLLSIVSPHTVRSFNAEIGMGFHKIHLQLYERAEAFRISAKNLSSDDESFAEFQSDQQAVDNKVNFSFGSKALFFLTGEYQYSFYFPAESWPPGVWFIEIDVKIRDRWGMLTNDSDQMCAYSLIVADRGKHGVLEDICSGLEDYGFKELCALFMRVHKILSRSYAEEAWKHIKWLRVLWYRLLNKIRVNCPENLQAELLDMLTPGEPDNTSADKLYLYNLGAYYPELYCLPKDTYEKTRNKQNAFFSCTRIFSKGEDLIKVFEKQHFDVAALFGFSNARKVESELVYPSNFNIDKYKQALFQRDLPERWRLLNSDDWQPGIGDYLGPMHYRYALHKLEDAYTRSLTAFSFKLGRMLSFVGMCSAKKNISHYCESRRLQPLDSKIDLGLFHIDRQCDAIKDEEDQRRENLRNIIRFFSFFAQICRCEVRFPGVLNKYFNDIKDSYDYSDEFISQILSYLLFIGEEMFGFYLLLWELIYTADCDMPRRTYVRD